MLLFKKRKRNCGAFFDPKLDGDQGGTFQRYSKGESCIPLPAYNLPFPKSDAPFVRLLKAFSMEHVLGCVAIRMIVLITTEIQWWLAIGVSENGMFCYDMAYKEPQVYQNLQVPWNKPN